MRAPISNGALTGTQLPTRLQVLGWGDNPSVKGTVKLSDLSASRLPARQQETGFDRVALDFEHNTVPGSPEYERSTEPRRVAAYGIPRIVAGEGLFLENLEWTPAGKAEALNYADLSPAVELDAQGNITFIHSVALTRNGAVEGLSFFNANHTTEVMADQTKFLSLIALSAILGLPESADEAQVSAELKKRLNPALPIDLTPLSASAKKATEDLTALTARLKALEDQIASGNAAVVERERDGLIARFSADGKVPLNAEGKAYSADELKKLDVPTLKLLHANTVATVPLSARGKTATGSAGGELKGLARTAAAFNQQLQH